MSDNKKYGLLEDKEVVLKREDILEDLEEEEEVVTREHILVVHLLKLLGQTSIVVVCLIVCL